MKGIYVCRKTIAKFTMVGALIGIAIGLLIFEIMEKLTPFYLIWEILIAIAAFGFSTVLGWAVGIIESDQKNSGAKQINPP